MGRVGQNNFIINKTLKPKRPCRYNKYTNIGFLLIGIGMGILLSYILFQYAIFIGLCFCLIGFFLIQR